jgi:hypothetical protein
MISSRKIGCSWRVLCVRDGGRAYRVLVGDLRERDHLEDLEIDRRIILNWIFKKWYSEAWS